MNIIISGGGGFLGKNLIEYLVDNKEEGVKLEIIVLDNFISSNLYDFNKFKENIKDTKISLLEFDICQYEMMSCIKKEYNKIDYIYHLSSLASPVMYKKHPMKTLDCGYIGTKNMLELAKFYNTRILFASTSEVYGDALETPQKESYYGNVNPFGERSCYDSSKRVSEALCYTYINEYNVNVKIARIFNSFGKYMLIGDGRIITEIIRCLINDEELNIYGDGEQTRSLCYARDTVYMLSELIKSSTNFPVNIGNDVELSINEITRLVHKVYKNNFNKSSKLRIKYVKLTQNDPLMRKPCLNLNKQVLRNFEYTDIEESIINTINYFLQ